ncbi:multisubunit Na+/H+ antiporter MnhC subunit [Microbacterium terrae]|uniref:TspO/MBR family protein n=1 Tax=Microbacterium terrae TaxID=69369 RepID=A0A0M2HLF1_9MICO|nr:TspO/MBR family protein [Microbacterium terrae]KJL45245.1 hypothetical protein RS81_00287 [Microbacterium terrae]MBP1078394.1 multisubunit Na+/H+ antiporter MnhC subunit [Microbacterium terrae]GLJ99293.1 tryptophan-rich sensory protein [Microbacterium terrae]
MAARDLTRQIVVISAFCFMIVAAMVGTGLLGGTPVQDLQDGALDADGSYLAPARQAFSIWTAIYVGLFAYTVWQALPGQRADERQRAAGWLVASTMAFNGLWLVTAQFGSLPLTVLAIVVLLAVLAVTFRRLVQIPPARWTDRLLLDGVTGLHLGWVTLATVANVTAWLTTIVADPGAGGADVWGVLVLVVVGIIGIAIGWASGWRVAPALAISWGLSWLAVGRLTGEPASTAIGVTAIVVAVAVLVVTIGAAVFARVMDAKTPAA